MTSDEIRDELLDTFSEIHDHDPDQFIADTPEKLSWCLRKIHKANKEAEAIAVAKERDVFLYDKALESKKSTVEHMRYLVSQGLKAQGLEKHADPVDGTAYFTHPKPRASVVDEDTALAWAILNLPKAVRESLDKSAITTHVKESGEVVPGVEMVQSEPGLTIKGV